MSNPTYFGQLLRARMLWPRPRVRFDQISELQRRLVFISCRFYN